MKDILESTLPRDINCRLLEDYRIVWNDSLTVETLTDFLQSAVQFLAIKKNKDKPVVLEVRDINGGFHFAVYVSFLNQTEKDSDEGSWSLGFVFDVNELEPDWEKYDFIQNVEAIQLFYNVTYANHGITWTYEIDPNNSEVNEGTIANVLPIILDALADYMRLNVATNPELRVAGLITFKAEAITNGVYIGATASPTLKQFIKNDNEVGEVI